MKQLIFKIGILIVIYLLICFPLSYYFDNYFATNLDQSLKPNWILAKKNQHYDFATLGASRVFNLVDIAKIESKNDNEGINLGASGTGLPESYILLRQFIKNGNTIDTLYLDINPNILNADISFSKPFHPYFYFPLLKDEEIAAVYKDYFPAAKYYLWRYVPMAKYFEYNNFLSVINVLKNNTFLSKSPFEKTDGSLLLDGSNFDGFVELEKKQLGINENDKKYLLKIIELTKTKHIPLIAYTAPELPEIAKYEMGRKEVYDYIESIFFKEKIPYHNFSNQITDTIYFKDYLHLNEKGIDSFSTIMADSLFQHNTIK